MNHIVVDKQRVGETNYLPADGIDLPELVKRGLLNDEVVKQMLRNETVSVIEPGAFAIAVVRRPSGSPWPPRGFTQGYLEEKGLVEKGFEPSEEPKPEAAAKANRGKNKKTVEVPRPAAAQTPNLTHVVFTTDAIQVGEHYLQPEKRGNFTFYTAAARDGSILRASRFRSVSDGTKFLEALSTPAPAPATPEPETTAEDSDGGDVRPSADGAEGQDPPEDR